MVEGEGDMSRGGGGGVIRSCVRMPVLSNKQCVSTNEERGSR